MLVRLGAVCSINLYGRGPLGRPTSPGSSRPAKERGRRAILPAEPVSLLGAQPNIHKAGPHQGW